MAPGFARRAEEFAALLEGTSTSGRDRHARLLDVVGQLQAVPAPPAPRTEFVADLRSRLMAEADVVLLPATRERSADEDRLTLPIAKRSKRSQRDRRMATAFGSVALVGAAATVAFAAQVALPGDTLYPVKRAIEDVRTDLAVGDAETGGLLLAHATERLDETESLTRRTDPDAAATEIGLRDFATQAQAGAVSLTDAFLETGEQQPIADLRDFTGASMERLVALEPVLPETARDELVAAAETVVTIDDDAVATCPSCGGAGVGDVPIGLTSAAPELPDTDDPIGGGNGPGSGPVDPPSSVPSLDPTSVPTDPEVPTGGPLPTRNPDPTSTLPTASNPTNSNPTNQPTRLPTKVPSSVPTSLPTQVPTSLPTVLPTSVPTSLPTSVPTIIPTEITTILPTLTTLVPVPTLPTLPVGVGDDDLGHPSATAIP